MIKRFKGSSFFKKHAKPSSLSSEAVKALIYLDDWVILEQLIVGL